MSTLKFRAWHEELKIMQDFDLTKISTRQFWDGQYRRWINTAGIDFCEGHNLIQFVEFGDRRLKIMRYLGEGCRDINHKEYCEDDIVRCHKRGIVKYEKGEWFLHTKCGDIDFLNIDISDKEIIGNIHQNPELFNGI